jgi:hypothetical protein
MILAALRNLPEFADDLEQVAGEVGLPYELLVAQCAQESGWRLRVSRYEPNYDRLYVSRATRRPGETRSPRAQWSSHAAWLTSGPTVATWFLTHPTRLSERRLGRDYEFVAQTRLASSWGPFQVMGALAVSRRWVTLPEDLCQVAHIGVGPRYLAELVTKAKRRGFSDTDAYKIGLACYNGGLGGNNHPGALRNQAYVDHVAQRYVTCWGVAPW